MLKPDVTKQESKMGLAGVEGLKMKKLIGALRGLWRSSRTAGSDDRITDLKRCLQPSPTPDRQPNPQLVARADGSAEESEGEPNPIADGSEQDASEDEDADHDARGDESLPHPDGSVELAQAAGSAEINDGSESDASSVDSINAPTLALGEESDDGEEIEEDEMDNRDSQAPGAGWLGQAYNIYNRIEREEREAQVEKDKELALESTLLDIRVELEGQIGTTIEGTEAWEEYKFWCRGALLSYGPHTFGKLAEFDNFSDWLSRRSKDIVFYTSYMFTLKLFCFNTHTFDPCKLPCISTLGF